MSKAIYGYLSIGSRQKIYLILVFVSLTLLFYSIRQIEYGFEGINILGLISVLSPYYWMGLALVLLTSISAFLDRELKRDIIFIIILMALVFFLFATRQFVAENALNYDAYYPASEVNNLLAAGHLDLSNPPSIATYYDWPAIHFISAALLEVTGASLMFIIKYTPFIWLFFFIFIIYGTGKRLKIEARQCFLLSFLAISSWQVGYAGYYHSRVPALMLFLLLFMLLIAPRRTVAETIAVTLMFATLVMSHGLTCLAVLPALILLAIYRREPGFVLLFIVIFGAWYMYQATTAFETGVQAFATPLLNIFKVTSMERYDLPTSPQWLISRYAVWIYAAVNAALLIGSAVLLLRGRIKGEHRKQVIAIFGWMVGVASLIFFGHGDVLPRTYFYLVVPISGIIVLSNFSRKLMIPVMCLFVPLFLLVNYAGLPNWERVTNAQLKGTEFFALEVKSQERYFYGAGGQLVLYHDPTLVTVPRYDPVYLPVWPGNLAALDGLRYIIMDRQASSRITLCRGDNPYAAWPQTEAGQRADLLYNNGDFQIYENHLTK